MENPSKSEVIGRCGGDDKKRMITQNRQKSNAKKNKKLFKKSKEDKQQFIDNTFKVAVASITFSSVGALFLKVTNTKTTMELLNTCRLICNFYNDRH